MGHYFFWLVWPVPKWRKFTGVGSRAQQKSQGLAGKALAWEGSQGPESREGYTSSGRLVTHQFWLLQVRSPTGLGTGPSKGAKNELGCCGPREETWGTGTIDNFYSLHILREGRPWESHQLQGLPGGVLSCLLLVVFPPCKHVVS